MGLVKKLVLDILKPHQPDALEFSQKLADSGDDYRVHLTVSEMDENTETVQVVIEGSNINFEAVQSAITDMGGSLHSIDIVEVHSEPDKD